MSRQSREAAAGASGDRRRALPAVGTVLERPGRSLVAELRALREAVDSIAIVVMHAYRAPELEREVGAMAREAGFSHVALSTDIASELGLLSRGDTAVVDAYLTPLLRAYLDDLAAACARDRRWTFQLVSAPLNVRGGVGSPPNALAIR